MPLVAPVILPEMYKIFTMAEVCNLSPMSQQKGLFKLWSTSVSGGKLGCLSQIPVSIEGMELTEMWIRIWINHRVLTDTTRASL
jgi:hypothetical protein